MIDDYKIEDPKKSRIKIFSLTLILLFLVVLSVLVYFFTKVSEAGSLNSEPVDFTISRGMSSQQVADKLGVEEVVRNPWLFVVYLRVKGAGNKVQAGEYLLDRKMSIAEIVDVLTEGKVVPNQRTITIIEGWSNRQIGARLNDAEFEGKYLEHQGYLFPDTYQLGKNEDSSELVRKMLKNFEAKVSSKTTVAKDQIILASIIEKEVGRNKSRLTAEDLDEMEKERRLVASVFYNRLEIGMALQSDATVNYITGKSDRQVTLADAKIKSPYNTYVHTGLPPTPISNPGLDSINAAVNPEKSDYLYFLNKPDGEAVFAKTLAEHNANKAKYLK